MYVLIDLNKTRKARSARSYETLPDGRSIVPLSDLRAFGSLQGVDIIATATELKQLIDLQQRKMRQEDNRTEKGGAL